MVSRGRLVLAGRYRLDELIAADETGVVWRAADTALGRTVAVKLLHSEYAGDAEARARFRAEARQTAGLAHPGIVQVYDYGHAGPAAVAFLVTELVEGPSLADVVGGGPLEAAWVLDLTGQAAAGLAAAHRAGLLHRDVKPASLLLAPGGIVKITGFAIACAPGAPRATRTATPPGTAGYLAPERASGGPATAASDLYSLGVLAWECLTGSHPFTGTPLEVAFHDAYHELPPLAASVPAGVAALVADLTAKDPSARPASAATVAARAGQLRAAITVPSVRSAAGRRPPRSADIRWWPQNLATDQR